MMSHKEAQKAQVFSFAFVTSGCCKIFATYNYMKKEATAA